MVFLVSQQADLYYYQSINISICTLITFPWISRSFFCYTFSIYHAYLVMLECLGSFRILTSNNVDFFTYQTIYVDLFGFISFCEHKVGAEE